MSRGAAIGLIAAGMLLTPISAMPFLEPEASMWFSAAAGRAPWDDDETEAKRRERPSRTPGGPDDTPSDRR